MYSNYIELKKSANKKYHDLKHLYNDIEMFKAYHSHQLQIARISMHSYI